MNRLLEAVLRTDLRFFIRKVFETVCPGEPYLHNWHIEAIAYQLERVFLGETTRLLINQPRDRSSRSASRWPMSLGFWGGIRPGA